MAPSSMGRHSAPSDDHRSRRTAIAVVVAVFAVVAVAAGTWFALSSRGSSDVSANQGEQVTQEEQQSPSADEQTSGENGESAPETEESQTEGEKDESSPEGTDNESGTPEGVSEEVTEKMASMTLEQKVAQLFIVRPEALTGVGQVTAAGETTRAALADMPVGGIVYFADNLIDTDQTMQMLSNTMSYGMEANGLPLFLCVDEEGGTVSRVGGNPGFGVDNVGNMSEVGATGDTEHAYEVAKHIGTYLDYLGFNVDFAPDSDIANNPDGTMGLRSFGATADVVSPMVAAQVRGFTDAGVLCSAKHFPGIGGALGDSHDARIYSEKTLDEIRSEELLPFEAAIEENVPFVMVGHLSMPNITGDDDPASISSEIVTDLLRDELGYDGIIITDSMAMGAATDSLPTERLGVEVERDERLPGPVTAAHHDAREGGGGREGRPGDCERGTRRVAREDSLARRLVRAHGREAGGVRHGQARAEEAPCDVCPEGQSRADRKRKVLERVREARPAGPLATLVSLVGQKLQELDGGVVRLERPGTQAVDAGEDGSGALLECGPGRAGPAHQVVVQIERHLERDDPVVRHLVVHGGAQPPAAAPMETVGACGRRVRPVHEARATQQVREVAEAVPAMGHDVAQRGHHVLAV